MDSLEKEMKTQWGGKRLLPITRHALPYAVVALVLLGWALIEKSNSTQLQSELTRLEEKIESQQLTIDRLERANIQPIPVDVGSYALPVSHVPERHAL